MSRKVLIIEDDASIRHSLLDLLEAEDYSVAEAENGFEGVDRAREFLPDLIICDIMMPDLDGYGVLEQLHKDQVTAVIPFIFLTAKADRADQRRGMGLGADDYLTKPFTRQDILEAIETRLAKRHELDRRHESELTALRESIALALPHELRTPLSGIKTGASVIVETGTSMTVDEIKNVADIVYQSAERLERLIVNYLAYAEFEVTVRDPKRMDMLRARVTPSATLTIGQEARRVAERLQRTNDLQLNLQDSPLRIADLHLMKLVEELLSNAFKFSLTGKPVQLSGEVDGKTYRLTVTDHGRGMTAEQIANYGAYIQFERKLHEQQGSGLGLFIARRITEIYSGSLTINSLYGQQTTVEVKLPI